MQTRRPLCHARRIGGTNPLMIVLMGAILVALVVLIFGVFRRPVVPVVDPPPPGSPVPDKVPDKKSEPPKPVNDSVRIKGTLKVGKTYHMVVKGGFDARVEDKDWAIKSVTNLGYAAEASIKRKVESNDGQRVIEVRTFETVRATKVLCEVQAITIDLGVPDVLVLGALESIAPGTGVAVAQAKPIVEAVLKGGAQILVADPAAVKVRAAVDSLTGKAVRITYVDGKGVEAIEPVGCLLTPDEQDFIESTAVLADCYLLPDFKSKPGDTWNVDGHQMAGFLDPSLRAIPSGSIGIRRGRNHDESGNRYTELEVTHGVLKLDSSDASTYSVGSFSPQGKLRFNLTDGYVELGELTGRILVEQVSKNHVLFESRFRTEPRLQITYSCSMQ